jgi:putative endonuclease
MSRLSKSQLSAPRSERVKQHWYFYVLSCRDGTLYTGISTDVQKRLTMHNSGRGAKYLRPKTRRPARVVYQRRCADHRDGLVAERAFKRLTRRQKEELLLLLLCSKIGGRTCKKRM